MPKTSIYFNTQYKVCLGYYKMCFGYIFKIPTTYVFCIIIYDS